MQVTFTSEQIVIDRIRIDKNRTPDEGTVRQLMPSIQCVGLLQPIVLWRPATGMGIRLVFGRNRVEAFKRLKINAISSRVVNGDNPEIRAWIAQAERDENLIRRVVPDMPMPIPFEHRLSA